MKSIAFVVRTNGLEYDDRIRKECITLTQAGFKVKIFVNFTSNVAEEGITSYGVPFESIKIKSRDWLPSGGSLLIKASEFFFRVSRKLNSYDLIWCHEEYTFLFPLLLKKRTIWDLHELPVRFDGAIMKCVFKVIEKRAFGFVHANTSRLNYLKKSGRIVRPEKHKVINNFPDKNFIKSKEESKSYNEFVNWLGNGGEYVYVQGLTVPRRLPYNTIKSILENKLKAVVVGDFDNGALNKLKMEYGESLYQQVYFTGMVPQLEIKTFLKNAKFSIVLYDESSPNNIYCEANRLYQAIALGVPVIVGRNPPMDDLVTLKSAGIVLPDFGNSLGTLCEAVDRMNQNWKSYSPDSSGLIWSDKQVLNILEGYNEV